MSWNTISKLFPRNETAGNVTEVDWTIYTWGLNGVDNRENIILRYEHPLTNTSCVFIYIYADINVNCSSILYYSIALVILVLLLSHTHHLILVKARHILLLHANTREAWIYWAKPANSTISFLKRHILWAPIGRIKHNREIRLSTAINFGTLPTRLQAVLLTIYFASNVVYCTILLNWDLPKHQLIAEFRGRTGVLAVANLVPLFLLAGRNNPLIWLFGINFDTYNLIHRWLGRIVVMESTCHITAWTVNKVTTSPNGWLGVWEKIQESHFVLSGLIVSLSYRYILFGICYLFFVYRLVSLSLPSCSIHHHPFAMLPTRHSCICTLPLRSVRWWECSTT